MNTRLKKFQAFSLAVFLLLNCLFTAAQRSLPKSGKVYTDYGVESEMRIPSKIMRQALERNIPRGTRVRQIRVSPLIFREAGGIMFDATGLPCKSLSNVGLSLRYNRTKPDGRRLTLRAGARVYTVDGIFDRDLQPIATFADDSVPILTNLQYPDAVIRNSCPLPSDSLRTVTLHPAVLHTSLGWLLTSMDSIPWSFSEGRRWNSQAALPVATASLAGSLASALRADKTTYLEMRAEVRRRIITAGEKVIKALSAEERRLYVSSLEANRKSNFNWEAYEAQILAEPGIDKLAWGKLSVEDRRILLLMLESIGDDRVSNINDHEASPSFCTQGSTVKLDGFPRLEFITTWYADNYTMPKSSLLMTDNISQLRLVDQEAYDGMIRIYRLGGLFRYVKQHSPFLWKQFLKSLPAKERKDTFAMVCPSCKKPDVEAWLKCVEKNFPSAD
jgi:hypothetical protein